MRLTILGLIIILPFYLCSCDNRPYPRTLQIADSLIETSPDSALSLLEQLKDSIDQEPEETQIYYKLLSVKVQDKTYTTHTSDSTIRQVLRYYRKKEDKKHLPEALYYAGRVCTDLGDATQALEYFQKAIEKSEGSTDYRLINRIYSQMGTLYLYQDVYDKAPEMFRKAYQYSVLAKDSIGLVYDLRDIGRSFSVQENIDSAIYYYKEADKLAESIDNQELRSMVNGELSGYYTKLRRYDEAHKSMQIAFTRLENPSIDARYCIAASYYKSINKIDSATFYYSKILNNNSLLHKQIAYQDLAYIARQNGELEKALDYFDKYLICADSLQKITQTESVRKTNALYNYQLRQKENKKLRLQTKRQMELIFFLATSLTFAVISLFAYRQYRQRKEQATQIQQEKLERIQEEQYKLSLAHIEKNKEQIKQLEVALLEAETAKDQLRHEILTTQKEFIEKTNAQIEAKQKVQQQSEKTLASSDIYKKFYQIAEGELKIENADWQELTLAIDRTYNQFSERLNQLYPIKERELQVCLLLKINMTPTQISAIILRSKQAITSIRKRLYTKAFNKEGTPEQWDNFIREL